ncbi:hypothetical protein V3564_04510 [Bartonella sp. B12(2025)]
MLRSQCKVSLSFIQNITRKDRIEHLIRRIVPCMPNAKRLLSLAFQKSEKVLKGKSRQVSRQSEPKVGDAYTPLPSAVE